MVRAVDVAAYTLNQLDFATTMKLQKWQAVRELPAPICPLV